MVRNLIFGGIAGSLVVVYAFVAAQLAAVGPPPGGPTVEPTRPPERTDAPRLPGAIAFVLKGDVYVLRDGRYAALTYDGRSAEPDLSDDGATLMYTRRESIDGRSIVDGQVVNARLGYTVVAIKPTIGGQEEVVLDGLRAERPDGFHSVWWYSGPALDPRGDRIAVIAAGIEATADLHVVTLPRSRTGRPAVLPLSQGAELADPAWSPDGTAIAVTTYNTDVPGILVWDAERPGVAERLELAEGEAYRPSFSPDGEWIVYTLRVDGRSDLHAFELASGTDVALTDDGKSWSGVVSPDGEWLAFLRERDGTVDLYAMEVGAIFNGGTPKQALKLTRGEGVDAESRPSWGR